jgi:hypothetical protein
MEMNQVIKTDSPCLHPGGEPGAWESMSIVGGTQAEHYASVARATGAGWETWIDGEMEMGEGNVPAAYLFRKLSS